MGDESDCREVRCMMERAADAAHEASRAATTCALLLSLVEQGDAPAATRAAFHAALNDYATALCAQMEALARATAKRTCEGQAA